MGKLVTTTKQTPENPDGLMNTDDLDKKEQIIDNDNERTLVIEYYLEEELVHRSVHVQLKKNVAADGIAAMIG